MASRARTRTVLVRPSGDVLHKFSKPVECLAIGYLGAALRESGREVALVDGMLLGLSEDETVDRILEHEPHVVGITNVLNHFPRTSVDLVARLRERGFQGWLVAGGHAVSFTPEAILRYVPGLDAVLCGEGERAVVRVAEAREGAGDLAGVPGVCTRVEGGISRALPERIESLDAVPVPARDLVGEIIRHDGLICVSTSRGCYARCSFCSVPRFYGLHEGRRLASGSWIARSVPHVVDEIVALHERSGMRELLVVDDEFFGGTSAGVRRARELGRALERADLPIQFALSCRAENVDAAVFEDLRRGGLRHVFVGLESGNPADLRLYAKGHSVDQNARAVETIKALGLSFQPGFMMFTYRSTLEQLRANLDLLEAIGELKPVTIHSAVDPHFGAPLTDLMRREGALREGELTLDFEFQDERVASAYRVAARSARAFAPYQDLVAGLQSSVTYEWRRPIPERSLGERELVDGFERMLNREFTAVTRDALDELAGGDDPREVEARAAGRLSELEARVDVSRALVLKLLEEREGRVRYRTQEELIAGRE